MMKRSPEPLRTLPVFAVKAKISGEPESLQQKPPGKRRNSNKNSIARPLARNGRDWKFPIGCTHDKTFMSPSSIGAVM